MSAGIIEIFSGVTKQIKICSKEPQKMDNIIRAINKVGKPMGGKTLVEIIADIIEPKIISENDIFLLENVSWVHTITDVLPDYNLLHIYPEDTLEEENVASVDNKIIEEIFIPDEKKIITNDSPVIVLSPINDHILKYLSEHPEEMYNLTDDDFEVFMAEIYSKLGYNVTRTQQTRDGGKDIIIRKPEAMGDFIYYVECKKYAAKRHIGVGILRNLVGTINTDRVNGGILATTSFFTKDARQFVMENNLQYQVKMQDYDAIRSMLTQIV